MDRRYLSRVFPEVGQMLSDYVLLKEMSEADIRRYSGMRKHEQKQVA